MVNLLKVGNYIVSVNGKAAKSDDYQSDGKLLQTNGSVITESGKYVSAPKKLYSFGVLSDLHMQYVTGTEDLQRALTYLSERVPFTCICGDLVAWASQEYMAQYKAVANAYRGDMLLYEVAGNHESYPALGVGSNIDETLWEETTGKPVYYSFSQGDDVFVMLGMKSERANDLFTDGALEWFGNTLEANRNKRCFVFFHAPELSDKTADPSGTWSSLMTGTSGAAFLALVKHYKNIVWFHGHTHVTLGVEQPPVSDIYVMGYRSIHIPSLVSPRFYNPSTGTLEDYYIDEHGTKIWGSTLAEGYIVDVYDGKIVVRGINYAAGQSKTEVEPFEHEIYLLDTSIQ